MRFPVGGFPWGAFCNNPLASGFLLPVQTALSLSPSCGALLPWGGWLVDGNVPPSRDSNTREPVADADSEQLARVGRGDDAALQRLFDKWKRPLLSFFYRSLGSAEDAEDLTLEVFVRLHRAAPRYEPSAKFSTFLFHIAGNLVRNEQRRRLRKPVQSAAPGQFDYLPEPHSAAARGLAELEEIFQRALLRLPERYRTPLLLLQQQQLDYAETAEALRMTENALRVLVHRGRQLLKREMEDAS